MGYVEAGGTFIVQYNRPRGLLSDDIGPYAFTISRRDRVSDETAPISFLNPAHQLLNFPNKISQKDFEGWVQERGLNFLTQWDEKYETILSSHDPNEPNREGGMLFTRYGKGGSGNCRRVCPVRIGFLLTWLPRENIMGTKSPENTSSDEQRAPMLSYWTKLYLAVFLNLVVIIVLLYIFTRIFE